MRFAITLASDGFISCVFGQGSNRAVHAGARDAAVHFKTKTRVATAISFNQGKLQLTFRLDRIPPSEYSMIPFQHQHTDGLVVRACVRVRVYLCVCVCVLVCVCIAYATGNRR